jgi:hypothetical protein
VQSATKTERITILGTPDFKAYLNQEAKREGISVSQLVRQRCEKRTVDKDEEILRLLVEEVRQATDRATASLNKGLADAEKVLSELRGDQI